MKKMPRMNECENKTIGRMLHDYELDHLKDEDRSLFELHILECDYCASKVRELAEAARLIRHDTDIKNVVATMAESKKRTTTLFSRVLLAAILVIVVGLPVYKFMLLDRTEPIGQTIHLRPNRSGGNVVDRERGGSVEIKFYANEVLRRNATILITTMQSDTILMRDNFSDFSDDGLGTIVVSLSDLLDEQYILTITSPDQFDAALENQYTFRVR